MKKLNRREFLGFTWPLLSMTGLGIIFGPVISYFFPAKLEETPSEPVLVCPETDLPEGESKTVRFGRYPALVVHTASGLQAYSAVCTHFACLVKWEPESGKIVCPCHDAIFDVQNGAVLAGPPPSPLEKIQARVIDGNVYIGGGA